MLLFTTHQLAFRTMRRIWPRPLALLVGLVVVAAVPWFSIGFL
jgi:hypothetical protein